MKYTRALPIAVAAALSLTAVAAPAEAGVRPRIQGVVVDQAGAHVDDVTVVAERPDGTAAASALSYASERPEGPQHGYFYLAVGRAGTYTVTLSKPGYRAVELEDVEVGRRGVVSLHEVELQKKLVPSSARLDVDRTLTTSDRAVARVRVSTDATRRPTGTVVVKVDGEAVRSVALEGADRGTVEVRLPRLARGAHTVKATYAPGSPYVRGSVSDGVGVTVRRGDHRVARAWLPGSPLLRVLP